MPVLTPTIWVILVAAFLQVITGLGWFITDTKLDAANAKLEKCEAKHQAFVDQTRSVAEHQAEKARIREAEQRRIADETSNGWAAALDRVRRDADRRVRLAAAGSAGGSGVSQAAQTGLAAPATDADAIPAPERVAADCAETTLTANFLQQYIERLER